jgi:hypothetical protein
MTGGWFEEVVEPIRGEIIPLGIQRCDQRVLFLAAPSFELFLAGDCVAHFSVMLMINQMSAMIALGECVGPLASTMLPNADAQVAGDTNLKGRSRVVRDDVDVVIVRCAAHRGRIRDPENDGKTVASEEKSVENDWRTPPIVILSEA